MDKKAKEKSLEDLYDMAEREGSVNSENLLLDPDTISMDGTIHEIDYEQKMQDSFDDSLHVIENMASLYFNDNESILNNKYIKDKIKNDAQNLSDLMFLQDVAKRAIVKQLEQAEFAEGSPRLFETMFQGMKEIREIIKQSSVTTSTMQNFYKELYIDYIESKGSDAKVLDSDSVDSNIMSPSDLNNKLDEILKKQQKK